MPKTYRITSEEAKKAREYMKKITDKKIYRRLEVIALRGEGLTNPAIVKITHFSKGYVPKIVSEFARNGFDSLLTDNRGGNNRKVTQEEEKDFLDTYKKQAERGKIITAKDMWKAFEKTFNVTIELPAFYRLLTRNNWRKVMPRSIHPKAADAETTDASKKLTQFT